LAKTPTVKKSLKDKGIANVEVCPVGLDLTLLKEDYEDYSPIELKAKYGYQADDKVVLFIGRLIDEKRPLDMLEIFKELTARNDAYKLLMVGTGELKDAVKAKIKQLGLEEKVTMRERIPNSDIWELYRFADTFVNLNRQEIFGMAILEAMYYGCKVVAWHAPGPDFIITDKEPGYLVSDNSQAVEAVVAPKNVGIQSHKRIINEFTWDKTAEKVRNII
jgi:1,2-diacylglycerol 3-alpha-glucosyltransferase